MTLSNAQSNHIAPTAGVQLRDLIAGYFVSRSIYAAASLNIAERLAYGSKSSEELARATDCHPQTLYRVLRALASVGVFIETEGQRFANTPISELLRPNVPGSLHALVLFWVDDTCWSAWQDIFHSVRTGEPAFDHVFGVQHFDYLSQNQNAAKTFDRAMVSGSSLMNVAIAQAYDFAEVKKLVDIAGGYGSTLCTILHANPSVRGVLFDMPHVIEGAQRYIAEQGLAERCDTMGGDFFASVPEGADAYFMKHILHDWDDERCVRILRNCHAAMPKDGKVLVAERVVPPGNSPAYAKLSDLLMLIMTPGGRERTEVEYRALFESGGFRLARLVPTESEHTILECVKI